ncbi:MAG: class I SAM-dependent methyltransferase [Clostridia bacterium]|nr:class I SAM-dependent methyltransferase [Clostridia bacterium]MDD3971906.1 class I SAM-dependent methyltransferase [Clostridia bacterium]
MNKNHSETSSFFEKDIEVNQFDEYQKGLMPGYDLIFQTMKDILEFHFKESEKLKGCILDVGAGTGNESMEILQMEIFKDLKIVAIDSSNGMKNKFEEKFSYNFPKSKYKYKYIVDDIFSYKKRTNKKEYCKIALSGYTIHHFHTDEKREIYQLMYDSLEPGGLMLNIDLFTYESEKTRLDAHQFDIDYIEKNISDKAEKEKWINHYTNSSSNTSQNSLDPVDVQIDMLKEIGFVDVECVFRYWQQGIIRATKPVPGKTTFKQELFSSFHLAKSIRIKNELLNKPENNRKLGDIKELGNEFKEALKDELGIIASSISVLSRADENINFLIESNVSDISALSKKLNNKHNFSISHEGYDGYDDLINFLYYVGRGSAIKYPEYLKKIKENEKIFFENEIQFNLRKVYETLHISAGEILLFTYLWRCLISLVKKKEDLDKRLSECNLNNKKEKVNWKNNPFSKSNNEYYLIEKINELCSQNKKNDVENNIIEGWNKFIALLNSSSSIDDEIGLDKNQEAIKDYVNSLLNKKFDNIKVDDFLNIINNLAPHLDSCNSNSTISELLQSLHEAARVPIIPFYFLMLGDKSKQLKEQIVFPLLHTFSETNTMYPYEELGVSKHESAVIHTLWITKPINEINKTKDQPWYSGHFSLHSYIRTLHEITLSICSPIFDEYYEKEHNKKIVELDELMTRSTVGRIINRNYAHHIGSHVSLRSNLDEIYNRITNKHLKEIDCANEKNILLSIVEMENKLIRYKDERNDFIAGIEDNVHPVPLRFYQDILLPFIENSLLMDNLAKSETVYWQSDEKKRLKYDGHSKLRIKVFYKNETPSDNSTEETRLDNNIIALPQLGINPGEGWKEIYAEYEGINLYNIDTNSTSQSILIIHNLPFLKYIDDIRAKEIFYQNRLIKNAEDIEISVPGSLGKHSIYSLLENIIRNTAKHANKNTLKNAEHLDIIFKIQQSEEENEKYDFYDVEITTNIPTVENESKYQKIQKLLEENLNNNCRALGFADMKINATLLKFDEIKQENLVKNLQLKKYGREDNSALSIKLQFSKPHKVVLIGQSFTEFNTDRWKKHGFWFFNNVSDCIEEQKKRIRAFQFAIISPEIFDDTTITSTNYDELTQHLPWRVLVPNNSGNCMNGDYLKTLTKHRRVICVDGLNFEDLDPEEILSVCWLAWIQHRYGKKNRLVFNFENNVLAKKYSTAVEDFNIPDSFKPTIISNTIQLNQMDSNYRYIFYDRHGITGIRTYQTEEGVYDFENKEFFDKHSWIHIDKNNPDFDIINSSSYLTKERFMISMGQWIECALHRILVVDERATQIACKNSEHSNWGASIMNNDSYSCEAAAGQVFIADSFIIKDSVNYLGESESNNISLNVSEAQIEISIFDKKMDYFDTLIIHRTMFDKLYQDKNFDKYWELLTEKFPNIIIDTGGGQIDYQPHEIMKRIRKISYSIVHRLLLNGNIAKYSLTNYL